MDFRQEHRQEWLDYFAASGYAGVEPLAAGTEGAVYRLGDGLVAKVWARRSAPELRTFQTFYSDLVTAGLPFGTPEVLRVLDVDGTAVTVERELGGNQLQDQRNLDIADADPVTGRCMMNVLRGLATVSGTAAMRRLPVLQEPAPFRREGEDFIGSLRGLLRRRVDRFGHVLQRRVPDFHRRYAALQTQLAALDRRPDTVLHGDLFAEHVLVDDALQVRSVLDFGFLSTAGDPRFDAAITAALINMYGEHAAASTEAYTNHFAIGLDYPPDVLRLYRAAYAVATSNAFRSDGSDGHFEWCARVLQHPAVTAVLGV